MVVLRFSRDGRLKRVVATLAPRPLDKRGARRNETAIVQ
jgi:hypothetical protein